MSILVIVENLLATMASVHQVVNGTRVLNAELARHPAPISQMGRVCQSFGPIPSRTIREAKAQALDMRMCALDPISV
jgi:hypothetical protein